MTDTNGGTDTNDDDTGGGADESRTGGDDPVQAAFDSALAAALSGDASALVEVGRLSEINSLPISASDQARLTEVANVAQQAAIDAALAGGNLGQLASVAGLVQKGYPMTPFADGATPQQVAALERATVDALTDVTFTGDQKLLQQASDIIHKTQFQFPPGYVGDFNDALKAVGIDPVHQLPAGQTVVVGGTVGLKPGQTMTDFVNEQLRQAADEVNAELALNRQIGIRERLALRENGDLPPIDLSGKVQVDALISDLFGGFDPNATGPAGPGSGPGGGQGGGGGGQGSGQGAGQGAGATDANQPGGPADRGPDHQYDAAGMLGGGNQPGGQAGETAPAAGGSSFGSDLDAAASNLGPGTPSNNDPVAEEGSRGSGSTGTEGLSFPGSVGTNSNGVGNSPTGSGNGTGNAGTGGVEEFDFGDDGTTFVTTTRPDGSIDHTNSTTGNQTVQSDSRGQEIWTVPASSSSSSSSSSGGSGSDDSDDSSDSDDSDDSGADTSGDEGYTVDSGPGVDLGWLGAVAETGGRPIDHLQFVGNSVLDTRITNTGQGGGIDLTNVVIQDDLTPIVNPGDGDGGHVDVGGFVPDYNSAGPNPGNTDFDPYHGIDGGVWAGPTDDGTGPPATFTAGLALDGHALDGHALDLGAVDIGAPGFDANAPGAHDIGFDPGGAGGLGLDADGPLP